ncbi:hypothetical protein BIV24_11220 [Streptomyces colonosanans]|uniref:NB-ARC domain-containing protein n=1 Tax=Streptomyces colonosanans TaxID=1428652 RepID=A0A1S2PK24_9ACTN|nr:hypothetical protein BIV24_11220 [Streptomyces colonosanans]
MSAEPQPAQLPHDLPVFTGRRAELDEVLKMLDGGGQHAETVVISAIGGMAGVGNTTLAVHWARQVADRYPDGQLYVNLRGFDPSGAVMDPGEAVRGFLDAQQRDEIGGVQGKSSTDCRALGPGRYFALLEVLT